MTATIRDIADQAGVSTGTVSRVLNAEKGVDRVLRERVVAAADQLGYIRRRRTPSATTEIGFFLVVRDVEESRTRVGQFWADILFSVESSGRTRGASLVFRALHNLEAAPGSVLEQIADLKVNAAFLVGPAPVETVRALRETGMTVVLVDNAFAGWEGSAVLSDDFGGAQLAVQHLVAAGHTKIAFIGGPTLHGIPGTNSIHSIARRALGYREALTERGLTYNPLIVETSDLTPAGGQQAMARLLDSGGAFTAVIAANDPTAVGVLQELAQRDIEVPAAVSVVGFDDHPPTNPLLPLTTVFVDTDAMGVTAVRLMTDALGDSPPPAVTATLPVRLIERSSSGRVNPLGPA